MNERSSMGGRDLFFEDIQYHYELENLFGETMEAERDFGLSRSGGGPDRADSKSERRWKAAGVRSKTGGSRMERARDRVQRWGNADGERRENGRKRSLIPAMVSVLVLACCTLALLIAQMVNTAGIRSNGEIVGQLNEITQSSVIPDIAVSEETAAAFG